MTGLLRSGAVKPENKPLWYDVYAAFPPKTEPTLVRAEPTTETVNILYIEDLIRS